MKNNPFLLWLIVASCNILSDFDVDFDQFSVVTSCNYQNLNLLYVFQRGVYQFVPVTILFVGSTLAHVLLIEKPKLSFCLT
jgi:hypothetical protein